MPAEIEQHRPHRRAAPTGLVNTYLEHVFRFAPEEIVALGAPHAPALRDPSPAGFDAEARAIRALLGTLDGEPLDLAWARRALRFRLHTIETGRAQRNLEVAMLPHAVSQYLVARGADPSPIAEGTAAFLARFAETLRAQRGTWEPSVVATFVEHVLPAARAAFDGMGHAAAADAYDRFRAAVDALERGPDPLGRDEVAWRLEAFDLRVSIDELDEDAARSLDTYASEAATVARELGIALEPGIVGRFDAMLDDVHAALVDRSERAVTFLRARSTFALPDGFRVAHHAAPAAMVHGNWPCPLLDPDAHGAVLVPASWPTFWADIYAVHEGAPGHYLQSWIWQHTPQRIARHVGVADDLAAASHDFAPMLGIEGWAVYAEELMRREGFFEGASRLAVLVSHAIRAVRVRVDLGLMCGTMSDDDAVRLYVERAWMPEGWARAQLVRHRRIPLQGLTYFAGLRSILALEAASDRAGADFRAWLLAHGPLSPDLLRD